MGRKRRPLSEQVVVITGASSGIGRETARYMAERGATVIAAARNETALESLCSEITDGGGRAVPVVADVADPVQVAAIGQQAIERFGRIDTWVNNAAVSIYATVEQLQPDEMRRLIEVNLLGVMYGSRVAVQLMRSRGGGTIINVGSVLSDRAVPLQSAYSASKHGIAGFSEALRLELQQDDTGIDVVLIQPSSINTPFFTWARSRFGVKPQPIPPVYEPTAVAEVIAYAAEHGGREIVVGGAGKLLSVGQWLSPSLVDRYLLQGRRGFRQQLTEEPDDRIDNLFQPSVGRGSTTGDFEGSTRPDSLYTRIFELHPIRKRLGLALGLVLATLGVWRLGRS
jgi:short-subunit dehydrogenase